MARSKGSIGRVTSVPLTAIGSGARTADLFPIPIWLFLSGRFVLWCIKHWYLAGIIYFITWEDSWLYALVFGFIGFLIPFVYMWANNKNRSLPAIVMATRYYLLARRRWRRACTKAELNDGPKCPSLASIWPWNWQPPKIMNDHGTALRFRLDVSRTGVTVTDVEDGREHLTGTLKARRARVIKVRPGVCQLIMEWDADINRSAIANPKDRIVSTQLPMAELSENVYLELDTSVLVVGESGSGKSNLTWNILNRLNEFDIPYRLYVIDPKKVELAELAEGKYTVKYTDDNMRIPQVIEEFYKSMMDTFKRMKMDGVRQIELNEQNPLRILVIDELLMCGEEVKGDVTRTKLGQILISGRAAGHIVIGNSQLGQIDVLGRVRDLFPQRVCMAVKSADLTNAVLGPKAEDRGARCTEITEKGVGYIFTDFTGSFVRFKPALITDIRGVSDGRFVTPEPEIKPRIPIRNPFRVKI